MKIMMINGSPHSKGCCNMALSKMEEIFKEEGIETEYVWLGTKPISGCIGCGSCKKTGHCIFTEDMLVETVEKFKNCDALIVASPVHYAAASGAITSFLDRFFYSSNKADLAMKPAAAVISCRRGGASAAFDQLNKYFTISQMPVVSSTYWNQVHGTNAEEVLKDEEGIRTVRMLAKNMAYVMKAFALAKNSGCELPQADAPVMTNFIRE